MKKILVCIFLAFLVFGCLDNKFQKVFADEFDTMMDVYGSSSRIKPVSEEEVQQILKKVEEKKNAKKKQPFWKRLFNPEEKPLKGDVLAPTLDGQMVTTPYLTLQIPCNMMSDKAYVPVGFYTVEFDEDKSNLILKQGHTQIAVIQMQRAPEKPSKALYYVEIEKKKDYYKLFYGAIEKHYQALLYPL